MRGTMLEIHAMPGHLIRRLNQISVAMFAQRVAAADIDITQVQFAAMSAIAPNEGLDQARLAGLIAYDRVTMGGVVDRLVEKGFVVKTVNPKDRRAHQLRLTPLGRKLLERLTPIVREVQESLLAPLPSGEREAFVASLIDLTDAGNERSRAPMRTA